MPIEVPGFGCANSRTLENRTLPAHGTLSIPAEVEKGTDLDSILSKGVLYSPGFAIDDSLVTQGSVPVVAKIQKPSAANIAACA